jgi:hypothetical protein
VARKKHHDRRHLVSQLKQTAASLQREVSDLSRHSQGTHSAAGAFNTQAPALLDAIQKNAHQFKKPPLGPLGFYLNVLDDR